jgi:thiamine biosynthesis lipoprotein ApbE
LLVLGPEKGMALAVREEMAALFLSRSDTGIREVASPAFDALSKS